ncbi:hypothetical protein CPJCM30710_24840 [Clostridium polyendosporum]|uniref:Bacteriophage lambda head decoration protein D n=1 Tax=Clostridium polyendosporum TaxID=69208 RepID=A0A919S218_9CLOT|nr:hypothetical protein [Clostridium polyendosporum]GIM29818.1 hypothetical protein CPJCM30710_24840 [Clostridium polyendosporum]
MRQSSRTIMGEQKNILALAGQLFQNTNIKVVKTDATLTNGILPVGTIVDKDGKSVNTAELGATAFGVVYEDVDFNNSKGTEVVPVTIFGFIKESALPVAPVAAVRTALKMIQFL